MIGAVLLCVFLASQATATGLPKRSQTESRILRLEDKWRSAQHSNDVEAFMALLSLALAEHGLIDEYEFLVQPRVAGHGPTLLAGLSKYLDLKLVSRREFDSGVVAMRYAPRR